MINIEEIKQRYINDIECMKEYINEEYHDLCTIMVTVVAVYGLININRDYWLMVDKILTTVDMVLMQKMLKSNGINVFNVYDDYIKYIESIR